jgi:hypothetical protein
MLQMNRKKLAVAMLLAGLCIGAIAAWWALAVRGVPPEPTRTAASSTKPDTPSKEVASRSMPTNDHELVGRKDVTKESRERGIALANLYSRMESEGRLAEYAKELEAKLKGDPADKPTLEELVMLYGSPMLRDKDKEATYWRRLLEYEKDAVGMIKLAQYEANRGNTDAAYHHALDSAETDPQNAVSHLLDGALILEKANDPDHAAELCQKAVATPGVSPRGTVIAAETLVRLRKYDEAAQVFQQTTNTPDSPTVSQRSLLGVCEVKLVQGQGQSVVPALQQLSTNALSQVVRKRATELLGEMQRGP